MFCSITLDKTYVRVDRLCGRPLILTIFAENWPEERLNQYWFFYAFSFSR